MFIIRAPTVLGLAIRFLQLNVPASYRRASSIQRKNNFPKFLKENVISDVTAVIGATMAASVLLLRLARIAKVRGYRQQPTRALRVDVFWFVVPSVKRAYSAENDRKGVNDTTGRCNKPLGIPIHFNTCNDGRLKCASGPECSSFLIFDPSTSTRNE